MPLGAVQNGGEDVRLIDKDTLPIVAVGKIDHKKYVFANITDAPTIDAIPVGWLIDRANDPERAPLYRRYAQMLYEEWQKEWEAQDG